MGFQNPMPDEGAALAMVFVVVGLAIVVGLILGWFVWG